MDSLLYFLLNVFFFQNTGGTSIRPSQFKIGYEINGEIKKNRMKNQSGG